MRHPLRERVQRHQNQARHRIEEARGRELQQDPKPREELDAGESEGGEGGDGAAGDGAEAGAADVGVEVAVPEVVDGAAGAAHDEGAGEEEGGCVEEGEEGRVRVCGGEEGGEEAWEEEVVCSRGLVEAH